MDQEIKIEQRQEALLSCDLPADLHPLAANSLEAFLRDDLPLSEFARLFSLANSAYLTVTDCVVAYLQPATATASLF